ncbi:hypothetical protein Q5P01_022174 [Channa striata]|uniref:Sushi domain-containing protein n=1 Tax=Channa striata TaxID=64152 RepID=A0AA88IWL5_CHASR|nr:hypothetical protein Q5P01_022174 [Channa striata]
MWTTYLGFVFLIWFPGELHAQSAAQPCSPPKLEGYFVPDQESYSHETSLSYACNDGRKPATEGWWARSTCENGVWSPKPQCIDENLCFPPNIPHAIYKGTQSGWYDKGTIRVKCDKGYELKNQAATAKCENGTWSFLPMCEKSLHTCGEPPKVPHAVIIYQEYQEVFPVDSEVQYQCEEGFTMEGGDAMKSIICMSGTWTDVPTCTVTGHDGSAEAGTGGADTTSADSETRTPSGANHCGPPPIVAHSDFQREGMFLKYQCNSFYKLHGSDTVTCNSDGTWSTPPICKDAFCVFDPAHYDGFKQTGTEYMQEGKSKYVTCVFQDYFGRVQCKNGKLILTHGCCHRDYVSAHLC